jgi:phosphoribosylformylglycinamidine cyclo-ligase
VGIVERDAIIDGKTIEPGNIVIGLESSGIHSNGYSLVRKALSLTEQKRMSTELLKPTRIYVKPVLALLEKLNQGRSKVIRGISHITGGAFYDKIRRILPATVDVRLDKSSWNVPQVFRLIQAKGSIEDREMYHTFNMGIGMVLVVEAGFAHEIIAKLSEFKQKSWIIGKVVQGSRQVEII